MSRDHAPRGWRGEDSVPALTSALRRALRPFISTKLLPGAYDTIVAMCVACCRTAIEIIAGTGTDAAATPVGLVSPRGGESSDPPDFYKLAGTPRAPATPPRRVTLSDDLTDGPSAFLQTDGVIAVELWYPRQSGEPHTVEIGLTDVRAADSIQIRYDFDRDGWAILQASTFAWDVNDSTCDPDWQEVAFVQAWARQKSVEGEPV